MIRIKFFAYLRETLGVSEMELDGQDGQTIAAIKQALVEKGSPWDMLDEQDVLFALNQAICGDDAIVNSGDELAFFPPVTGG
ncbi:molybdopterin converting factor subunit 1 [Glaciecola sp. XM2]|jgi:molybdopterin synthase sulfur carrier subunit|uniref:molybdopterin converting factor subunit 1 n=1 Tax=Glaciecola sp. XM2 TaxID=1914931 RepID=UPI001BDF1BA7|nr:molybdopterin converting factor subunit 1 [Glaciecola sp. XM2]MBT1450017.1 molybdopterin converting factor subunit 1 [Glaciecola sp. XM2]